MAFGRGGQGDRLEGFKATTDLSSYQWHFVKMAGTTSAYDYTITVCNGSTDNAIGVLQNAPNAAGKSAEILSFGSITKVLAGGTINCGAVITTNSSGHALTLSGVNAKAMGIALSYGVSGDYISVLLCCTAVKQAT
jgi:hypothetical protein